MQINSARVSMMVYALDPGVTWAARAEVEAAFPEGPPPADLEVVTPGHYFDEAGKPHRYAHPAGSEPQRIEAFFARRPWRAIPVAELLGWKIASSCFSFLSPEGRAFYLPAFLRAFLSGPLDDYGLTILDASVRALTPPTARWGWDWPDQRTTQQRSAMKDELNDDYERFVRSFTRAQKATIARFLKIVEPVVDEPGVETAARNALDAYWAQFLK